MDLKTTYLGLELPHPIMASASPLTADYDGICRLADAGAAAVVMSSIYEEQVIVEELTQAELLDTGRDSHPEAHDYFPSAYLDQGVLAGRLETLRRARERTCMPIIASLNGISRSGWIDFAIQLEQAGASAIELNINRIATDFSESGPSLEQSLINILRDVKARLNIPVAIKLNPYFSSLGHLAGQLVSSGADGLVLFNRFYGTDIDLLTFTPRKNFELSTSYDIRYGLLWISLLSRRLNTSLAASSGVWCGEDIVKYILVGADAVMTTSALLQYGPQYIKVMLDELTTWMKGHDYLSLEQVKGKMTSNLSPDEQTQWFHRQYRDILNSVAVSR